MKNRYFKHIEIDKMLLQNFLNQHPAMTKFVSTSQPFYVRVSKKLYAGLIHTIISQDGTSEQISIRWNQLNDFAKKIKESKILDIDLDVLNKIVGGEKAAVIRNITNDIVEGRLDLKSLAASSEEQIINTLQQYQQLTLNTIKTFALFCCFKQDVLCDQDPDFIQGLQIFLNKQNITEEDINNIKIEYRGQLTLFSLCMWKIRNERAGK